MFIELAVHSQLYEDSILLENLAIALSLPDHQFQFIVFFLFLEDFVQINSLFPLKSSKNL